MDLKSTCTSLSDFSSSTLGSKRGWLLKKSPSVFKSWQARFFILHNKKLTYYASHVCTKKLGVLNFDHTSLDIQLKPFWSPTKLIITLIGHGRRFILKSKIPKEISDWAVLIHEHIQHSFAGKIDRIRPKGKFWKRDSISNDEFVANASTGDIVLFQSKAFGARIQRCFTRSTYDHVALVLRDSNNEISFLEATGDDGVSIVKYYEFFEYDWIGTFNRIAFRHLEIYRSVEFIRKLKEFISDTIGKRYKLNPKKLIKKACKVPGSEENFFCSELVASAYKKLGLLPEDVSACSFWPGDFAESSSLELENGWLAPELNIDYNL